MLRLCSKYCGRRPGRYNHMTGLHRACFIEPLVPTLCFSLASAWSSVNATTSYASPSLSLSPPAVVPLWISQQHVRAIYLGRRAVRYANWQFLSRASENHLRQETPNVLRQLLLFQNQMHQGTPDMPSLCKTRHFLQVQPVAKKGQTSSVSSRGSSGGGKVWGGRITHVLFDGDHQQSP
jgi:hypothetical protein